MITPIIYSKESKAVEIAFVKDPILHINTSWFEERFDPIKKEIKEYYKDIQNRTCPYCSNVFDVCHSACWDIEHIVPRASHPWLMFEPMNLCVACKDCNSAKSSKNVFANKLRKTISSSTDDYIIIHPLLDEYEEHISVYCGYIYAPKTEKGKRTIEICDLLRFSVNHVKVYTNSQLAKKVVKYASEIVNSETDEQRNAKVMELVIAAQIDLNRRLI